jgi:hypothetical protein
MLEFVRSRLVRNLRPCLVLAGAMLAASVSRLSAQGREGWRVQVEINSRGTSERGLVSIDTTVVGRLQMRGLDMRLDILRSNDPYLPRGSWIVSADGGRTLIIVDPLAQRFSLMQNASSARAFFAAKGIRTTTSGITVQGDTLGPCGGVAGHATTCFRFVREYTQEARYYLVHTRERVREEFQFWTATDLPTLANPVARFFTDMSAFVTDAPDAVMRAERVYNALFPGVPLRVRLTESTHAVGDTTRARAVTVTDAVFTSIERAAVDVSTFEIPKAFRFRRR